MNFLALCQRARSEMGVAGQGPTAVLGQTGMAEKIVNWVNDAYLEIQGKYNGNWRFMWRRSDLPITAGKTAYVPLTDWGIDIRCWSEREMTLYRVSEGPNARYWPEYIDWLSMTYMLRTQMGLSIPQYFSERPDQALVFRPTPDQSMVLEAGYFLRPARMTQNTDIPRLPEEFHMAIVWRAVMMYAGSDEAPLQFKHAATQYAVLMNQMAADQLEPMQYGPKFA